MREEEMKARIFDKLMHSASTSVMLSNDVWFSITGGVELEPDEFEFIRVLTGATIR